ncbi:MAG: sulfite exporter TauE/SafE family protein [Sedimentisphaerales bacterium]|nr:sulfite exporter TauE/SafE family protein [Sedimentisphaerales bacterium]
MEVTLSMFLLLFAMAFVCEFIDSALGMGYGTILSPVLIIMGFDPLVAVPALLLSQAFGGFTAAIFHHQFENARFTKGSRDLKVVLIITSLGIGATIFAACLALNVPKTFIKGYIGVLVLVMGIIMLSNKSFKFSWKRMLGIGILSSFNKALSGGGFGPVVTAGQVISGQEHKGAIAATTLAEAPICTVAFLTYMIGRVVQEMGASVMSMPVADFFAAMFSAKIFHWELVLALLLGSVFVAPFGAFTTKIVKTQKLSLILGILVVLLGVWTLWKTFV